MIESKRTNMMSPEEIISVKREIDKLRNECQELRGRTLQKYQERQLLLLAISFIVGFVFAQWFYYY